MFSIASPDGDGNGNGDDDERGLRPDASASSTRAPLVRRMVGEVALDLATTPEGRAVGLSVEIWPDRGVWLRVRAGHELRITVERHDRRESVRWQRVDPNQGGARTTDGDLGSAESITADDLRQFVTRWLGWRAGG